jgi:hypothetical protein
MNRFLMWLALAIAALPVVAQDYLPRDVQRFMNRREGCDQVRREVPDANEKLRRKDVDRSILRLCIGTDKELTQLKRKYANNSTIMQLLNQFESGIEVADVPLAKGKAGK